MRNLVNVFEAASKNKIKMVTTQNTTGVVECASEI